MIKFSEMSKENKERIEYGFIAILSVIGYLVLMWIFTGRGILSHNIYNSYALQADSWRMGRLDLLENYSYLELAQYNGKFYVSFPVFPSYILYPLTFIFGAETPDALLLWTADVIIVLYLYKLALKFHLSPVISMLLSLFAMLGSNVSFTMLNPWVWFWAQTLCFMFAVLSIYYAYDGRGGLALAFWACGVGCRPMQFIMLPLLLAIIYKIEKHKYPDETLLQMIRNRLTWVIAPIIIGSSYMVLNYYRFDNPFEFGHNYLPEFTEAEYGQFSTVYFRNNLKILFHIPTFDSESRMEIDHFGNLNFMIVSPIVVFALLLIIVLLIKKYRKMALWCTLIICFCCIYLVITMMHKTMGGWGFGNRYSNDILPWIYLICVIGINKSPRTGKYIMPAFIFSICLNAVGVVAVYNNMYIF